MVSSAMVIHIEKCQHIHTKRSIIKSAEHFKSVNSYMEEHHPYEKGLKGCEFSERKMCCFILLFSIQIINVNNFTDWKVAHSCVRFNWHFIFKRLSGMFVLFTV